MCHVKSSIIQYNYDYKDAGTFGAIFFFIENYL